MNFVREAASSSEDSAVVRVALISSVGMNVQAFFRGQLNYLQQHGFQYTVITSDPTRDGLELPPSVAYLSVPISRSVTPLTDLRSLFRLCRIFRRNRFDLVQYTTPKGALLGSIAAFLARVPIRLYLFWGVYYSTQTGWKRRFFKMLDWLACRLSTHVTFDGEGIRQFAIAERLCSAEGSSVVGVGGDNGINLACYSREKWRDAGLAVRRRFVIPVGAVVVGTVARLVGDKGINELVSAFARLAQHDDRLWLLLVGPEEDKDAPSEATLRLMREHPRIVRTGAQREVCAFYAAMDIFVLATYREGFSAVTLEAQSMCLPVVTTEAIGAGETIVDGHTGIVVPIKSVDVLADAIGRLSRDVDLRRKMGENGRAHVAAHFEQQQFWENVRLHRENLLLASGRFQRRNDQLVRLR